MTPTDRRAQLLAAAKDCFLERGFSRTPVSAVVQRAGVAQGTFYLYFKSKNDLIHALRKEVVQAYERILMAEAALPRPVDERLARMIRAMSRQVERHLHLEQMFRQAGSGESHLIAAQAGRTRLTHQLHAFLIEDPDIERRTSFWITNFIVTLFDQILFEAHAFHPESVDEVVVESQRFVLRALGASEERIQVLVSKELA